MGLGRLDSSMQNELVDADRAVSLARDSRVSEETILNSYSRVPRVQYVIFLKLGRSKLQVISGNALTA